MKRINDEEIREDLGAIYKAISLDMLRAANIGSFAQLEADREDMRDLFKEMEEEYLVFPNELIPIAKWRALKDKYLKEE